MSYFAGVFRLYGYRPLRRKTSVTRSIALFPAIGAQPC